MDILKIGKEAEPREGHLLSEVIEEEQGLGEEDTQKDPCAWSIPGTGICMARPISSHL